MKIFVNKDIRQFFITVLICIILYIVLALLIIGSGLAEKAFLIFILSMFLAGGILAVSFRYFARQNKTIEQAVSRIASYLSGNRNARIECMREGELYRLFHEVNTLASVLNAHAENELRGKEFLKNIISDISHQLKTPIAALNIYNGLIQNEAEDLPEIKDLAALSEQELDRMEILVQNLLKITKFDAGTIVINKTVENVSEMMNCVLSHFAFRAEQEGKKINAAGDQDITLLCDRDWLMEAIDNIVKNALDHTRQGGAVSIAWKQMGAVLQVTVRDNGSGIHPEDLHHIFKRFYRSRFSQDIQGVGLGLPLAKTIIEAHNGSIEVDSELGRGTAFVISFLV